MQSATSSYAAPATKTHASPIGSGSSIDQEDFSIMVAEVSRALSSYCAKRPRVVAGCIFAMGFVVGWKMKPW